MRSTTWRKYESDGDDGFPKGLTVDVCEALGEIVEFDKKYSEFYFIPKEDDTPITVIGDSGKKLNPPSDLKKSCKWVEERIYKDCKKQDWIPVDILRILAWKTGKINHSESMKTEPNIIYYGNWVEGKEDDKFVSLQIPYQNVVKWIEFAPIVRGLMDIRKEYCDNKNPQSAWNYILSLANDDKNKNAMRGIGTVYLITLLHFITDGEVPIYDRFVMASLAIWKLKNDQKGLCITDKSVICGCKLPSKDTKAAINILESGIYSDYIHLLKEFCKVNYGNENEWKTNRDVDRALWVFGHYFEVDE